LGDRDLALHLLRHELLYGGAGRAEVTATLAARLGVDARVLPMTESDVHTIVRTAAGELPFQEWFVRARCDPPAIGLRFEGASTAQPGPGVVEAIHGANVVVLAPSNPFLSLGAILAVPGLLEAVSDSTVPVVAVSPLVGGRAVKGPTAQMLEQFEGEATAAAVARGYGPFLDGFVLDERDASERGRIEALGIKVLVTDTLMTDRAARRRLAQATVQFAEGLAVGAHQPR
jgi:LPPG:FO 2-phospho-L-lactate transferase